MVFKRKIYSKMLEWKTVSHGESALMIEGARRIGKSTIALAFAKNEYEDYMILDFAQESQDVRHNFEENIGELDVFFRNLFLLKGRDLPKGKSVIIFDEVQLFPAARQAIKFLVQDGRYDYIETGSLISIKKNVSDLRFCKLFLRYFEDDIRLTKPVLHILMRAVIVRRNAGVFFKKPRKIRVI